MNKRFTSLISLITFFAGPIACSDAGDIQPDSRGRDTQALTAAGATRDLDTEDEGLTNSLTIGASPTSTLTPSTSLPPTAVSATATLTLGPALPSGVTVGQSDDSVTLSPVPTSSGGEIRVVDGETETDGRPITWGSGDAGVEIRLGVDVDDACLQLKAACIASGETQQTCDGLVVECEEAIANPSAPTDSIGFVTDCDEMGTSCRAAGVSADECDKAVEICKSSDAGAAPSPATIVTSCEQLRSSCEQAGLSDSDCDRVVSACEDPPATTEPGIGLTADCAELLATCLSYGIAKEECEAVRAECETNVLDTDENDIQLK